jgi:GntR family transcriptional regulator
MAASGIDWTRRLAVDPGQAMPLYYQLRERLRSTVREYDPETPLPTEREIMAFAGVSRATTRRAIADLVSEGVLVTRQGSGTYLAPPRVSTELGRRPQGFTESMTRLGRAPSTTLLEVDRISASPDLAERLDLAVGAPVAVIERLRRLDGEPCMVERAHLPLDLVPGLLEQDLTGSLYDLLRLRYGLEPALGSESIVAVNADHRLARLLDTPVAAALLATSRSTRTTNGTPLEYTLRHARGDRCAFLVEFDSSSAMVGDHSQVDPSLLAAR